MAFPRREDPDEKFREMRERMDRDFFGRESPFFRPSSGFEDLRSQSPSFRSMGFPEPPNMSGQPMPARSASHAGQADSIPIRVIHEGGQQPHRPKAYNAQSKTSDLPPRAAESADNCESPRLARAHSEPPKSFSQRILRTKAPLSGVPENNDLSMSASDPSVPNQDHAAQPTDNPGQSSAGDGQQHAVRHIPIFVEGRSSPVMSSSQQHRSADRPDNPSRQIPKRPSDFYPAKVEKRQPTTPLQAKVEQSAADPTSPLSPIPSDQPIPMGYVMPESEQDLPAGPIPMPCRPELADNNNVSGTADEDVANKQSSSDVVDERLKKLADVQATVDELAKRLESFTGEKKDKEYVYLDEMLTRNLLILDGIETDGRTDVRQQRKESIRSINRYLSILESKANRSTDAAKVNNDILSTLAQESGSS